MVTGDGLSQRRDAVQFHKRHVPRVASRGRQRHPGKRTRAGTLRALSESHAPGLSAPTPVHLQVHWESAEDAHTEVVAYEACVGSAVGQCDRHSMTPVATSESNSHQFVLADALRHGEVACVSVEALNDVHLRSERVSSDCATADDTPPACTFVGVGLSVGAHTDKQAYRDILFGHVVAEEDVSSLETVEWCASSDNSSVLEAGVDAAARVEFGGASCDVVPPTTVGIRGDEFEETAARHASYLGVGELSMSPGSQVWITARVRTSARQLSPSCCSPLPPWLTALTTV